MARSKKTAEAETITIPEIELASVLVSIVGTTPLLTNRFSDRARQAIEGKQQHQAKGPKEARDPEAEFRDALHLLPGGVYGWTPPRTADLRRLGAGQG